MNKEILHGVLKEILQWERVHDLYSDFASVQDVWMDPTCRENWDVDPTNEYWMISLAHRVITRMGLSNWGVLISKKQETDLWICCFTKEHDVQHTYEGSTFYEAVFKSALSAHKEESA